MGKNWDMEPEPNDARRRAVARESDMHVLLVDGGFDKENETLCGLADSFVDQIDSFLEKALYEEIRDNGESPETDAMLEEREHHIGRVARILIQEAVARATNTRSR